MIQLMCIAFKTASLISELFLFGDHIIPANVPCECSLQFCSFYCLLLSH